jgi:hypothetical protein
MPEPLWIKAAKLARELGVNPVRKALGLNFESLKLRVEDLERGRPGVGGLGGRFVELSGAQLLEVPPAMAGPVVELTEASGIRVTVRFPASSTLDLFRLVEAFRGRPA